MGSRSLRVAGWTGSVLFAALYVAFLYNWRDPHVRLTVPSLNYLALGFAQAIPFLVAIVLVLLCRRWWSRLMVGTLSLPVVAMALLIGSVASCCAVEYRHGTDLSFERLRVVPTRFGSLVVYRTNGGAMTSYGIVVRQECPLVSGVTRVRDIGGGYPASDVDLDVFDDRVHASFPVYRTDHLPTPSWTHPLRQNLGCPPPAAR
jgi:hypothetical protein